MNLPIFRDLYKLNVALLKDIENIPKIHRHTLGNRIIDTGDRIVQMVVARYEQIEWQHAEVLNDTERGAGGFGSTGK